MPVYLCSHTGAPPTLLDRAIVDVQRAGGVPDPSARITHSSLLHTSPHGGRRVLVEAIPPRVRTATPTTAWLASVVHAYRLPLSDDAESRLWRHAQAQVGVTYDALPGFLVCAVYELTGVELLRARAVAHRGRYCSELCCDLLREAGLDACPGKDAVLCSPGVLDWWALGALEMTDRWSLTGVQRTLTGVQRTPTGTGVRLAAGTGGRRRR